MNKVAIDDKHLIVKSISKLALFPISVIILFGLSLLTGPEIPEKQFYVELDRANNDIYLSLLAPRETSLTHIDLYYQDTDNYYHFYGRRIVIDYSTSLAQEEIITFYKHLLGSQGWKDYHRQLYKDDKGLDYFEIDRYSRGSSCIDLSTGPYGDTYLVSIHHNFLIQDFSLAKLDFYVYTNLVYRDKALFDLCPQL